KGAIQFCDPKTLLENKDTTIRYLTFPPNDLRWLDGDREVATADYDHAIRFWDVAKQRESRCFDIPPATSERAVSPGGRFGIATQLLREGPLVTIWDLSQSREQGRILIEKSKAIPRVLLSVDGKRLLLAVPERVYCYDLESQRLLFSQAFL